MDIRLWAVAIPIAVLTACGGKVPPYPPLEGITRVEVRGRLAQRDTTVASIADPERIGRILAFVNARCAGWERPWAGIPVPIVVADFYRGSEFMGHVGSGASFLETQREDDFASRSASPEEVAEFNALLGIGTKVVAVPPKRP
ncbi:MAG TPA: hypothetical protein VGH98_18585 [Gemmatimonadaceae bacterium]|jgi:hypothetical protein